MTAAVNRTLARMRLKLFQASTMGAAMATLRAELGPDALILTTRRVQGGVELTAALAPEADAPPTVPDPARAAALADGPLASALEAALSFAPLDFTPNAPPLLLAGPPGAGKTLTAARLATRLVLAGIRPLVVTADGRRAGAAEQLAAFTRLLDLDLLAADGTIAVDNTLMQGEPWTGAADSVNGPAIAAFNATIAADDRVEQVLLPVRDGVTLIRRRR